MVTGFLLILFGVLVAIYPRILVAMVATILIVTGVGLCLLNWQWRRLGQKARGSWVNWMIRF